MNTALEKTILLTTLNSRYSHAAFGLRYLFANLGELQPQAEILEFTIQHDPRLIADQLVTRNPRIIGFGVYIWNTTPVREVVRIIKAEHPEIIVVLGGPEVSYEAEPQEICQLADYVIQGEADFLFREFCELILSGAKPLTKFIKGVIPEITAIKPPYALYTDADVKNRVIYVEASRGCPYKCEYCLSSLDKSVRAFNLDFFLSEMKILIDRGVRQFKFVDRTFNLSITTSQRIMNFFLEHINLGLFLHFEMVPDRLPIELRDLILKFPAGSLQFEIGIQTWNPAVAANVSRRQNYEKIKENLAFLSKETGVHTHVDLIVGLPGETLESFAVGFNEVARLGADEIQVGVLKYLKGTPIARHKTTFQMDYSTEPPFTILQNKDFSTEQVALMTRFAKFWDLIANSGNFQTTTERLREAPNFFDIFMELSLYLFDRHGRTYAIQLQDLAFSVFHFWTEVKLVSAEDTRAMLVADFEKSGRTRHMPTFLKMHLPETPRTKVSLAEYKHEQDSKEPSNLPARQRRHQTADSSGS